MKTLLSLLGGAITVTEINGVVSLNWNESLGGGAAAGILKGSGSLQLAGLDAVHLGEALLNAKLPASMQGAAVAVEGVIDAAIKTVL